MHDEFRVKVEVDRPRELLHALEAVERGSDAQDAAPRAAVTHEGEHLFIYTDSLQAAERALAVVREAMSQRGLSGKVDTYRWHPLEERWEDASAPLPASDAERAAEHARLEALETEESQEAGVAEWEVRITLPTHHDARAFAERLRGEGISVNQRWKHLLVGANDEDDAAALAERLRVEAPPGSEILSEGSGLPYWQMLHPYAYLGGMGN
jgi:nucleotide-binding universal stress UspA family protein